MKTMGLLILIFAFSIAVATFIENDYGTESAKALVYSAKWFEFLLFLLALNLAGNIFKYKLYQKNKFPVFIFHLSFLVILLGAGITRYFGYEGIMHIREGQSVDTMVSDSAYVQLKVANKGKHYDYESKVLFSSLGENSFKSKLNIDGKELEISLIKYIQNAQKKATKSDEGTPVITMVVASNTGEPKRVLLQEGESDTPGGLKVAFDKNKMAEVMIYVEDGQLKLRGAAEITVYDMATNTQDIIPPQTPILFEEKKLYTSGSRQFVLQEFLPSATVEYVATLPQKGIQVEDLLLFEVKSQEESKKVFVFGEKGVLPSLERVNIGGLDIALGYGSKLINLPFSIKLDRFIMTRYPGSMSPSSYRSEVEVIDGKNSFPYSIYMNHILDHRGYRFYQASFDMDEKGTILSVNYDKLGTTVTYIGYAMLTFGMFLSLFLRHGRVIRLASKIKSLSIQSLVLTLLMVGLFHQNLYAQDVQVLDKNEIIKKAESIDKEHAKRFGRLLLQDVGGRVKPVETMSYELLSKIHGKDSFSGLHPTQVVLGMLVNPDAWEKIKIIKVGNDELKEKLGLEKGEEYAAFIDFFNKDSKSTPYILTEDIESALQTRPSMQSKYDKEVIKVDERLNISYIVYTGSFLNIFPLPNDKNKKWYNPIEAMESFPKNEADSIKQSIYGYFGAVEAATQSGDWSKADAYLDEIKKYQDFYGASIIPHQTKIDAEIFYYNYNIFKILLPIYGIFGLILLFVSIVSILSQKLKADFVITATKIIFLLAFLAHTAGLGLRWYISGHAPWSDGYESMLYISWATIFAGLLLVRNNPLALSASAVMTAIILFVAHLSWMDPQITNLVPVLNSYWLTIHVSVITASYGFFGLGALLGVLSLFMMSIKSERTRERLELNIKELTYINEISLLIGLALLTIGNFLGGVWANESWGRYWGWDPKETWALVTILVYAFVVHMRFIRPIYTTYSFNIASAVAFFSVLMTYFGVNFYLSGLHSYAKGDPVPIPMFVYVLIGLLLLLFALAYPKRGERSDQKE